MVKLKESQHLLIPFEEIKEATKNFKDCIGKGGYGRVYKGELLISGQLTTVAVKRLNEAFGQGSKEFLTEIELLKGQKHTNLISLLGYCEEGKEKIIVYEYAERGSLDQYIRFSKTKYCLTWMERLRICVGIARGLNHLHNHFGNHQAVIHRDIKSSNILLDRNWVAKISDLGLSTLSFVGLDRSTVISAVCGTPGYCEPEYMATGIVKKESDIFSFGMVLLEILCGRLCTMKDDGGTLSDYYKNKKIQMIIDPTIGQQMSPNSLISFLKVVHGCLHKDREQRHPIHLVMKDLEETIKIESECEVRMKEKNLDDKGKKIGLISSDGWEGWISENSFATLVTRRTNVGKIFDMFDLDRDGGLSRKEVAAFLFVTKHDKEKLRPHEVLHLYDKYVDGIKGLTYYGLLQYYDDGYSDLDSDFRQLISDSGNSSGQKKLMRLFQNGNNYLSDILDSEALELFLKPENGDEVAVPETLVMTQPLTVREKLSYIIIALMILSIATLLEKKLKNIWILLVILYSCLDAFVTKRLRVH